MKAAVVEGIRKADILEVPDPNVSAGSLKIRVEACAICGSDLRIFIKGDPRAVFPVIIGHEIAGVVTEVGEGTGGFTIGDRVCAAPGHGCGECKYCKNDMGNVCISPLPSIGYASSGGFAQYIVPPVNVVKNGFVNKIPDNLSFEQASMSELLACCINSQERAGVGKGDNVLVMGPGPAGCMHVQLAKARGAGKVMLSGHTQGRLKIAEEKFHPDVVIYEQGEALEKRVLEETKGIGADVIIVAAPSHEAQEQAIRMAAPRGRINFFGGLPKDNCISNIEANLIHYKEIMLTGASSSLGRQNKEALELISKDQVKAIDYITHRFALDEFKEAMEAVEQKKTVKAIIYPWKTRKELDQLI